MHGSILDVPYTATEGTAPRDHAAHENRSIWLINRPSCPARQISSPSAICQTRVQSIETHPILFTCLLHLQWWPFRAHLHNERRVHCYAFRIQLACMYVGKKDKVLGIVSKWPL